MLSLVNSQYISTKNKEFEQKKVINLQKQDLSIKNVVENRQQIYPSIKLLQASLIPFTSRVTNVYRGKLPDGLADKIDRFEEGKNDNEDNETIHLGEGMFATVYKFVGEPYVIKESLPDNIAKIKNNNFSKEAEMLEKVSSVPTSQKLVAQVKTEKDNYYLISTLVQGTKPDPLTNPLSKMHLSSIFKNLRKLDELGIYHNDLNTGNCLIHSDGSAGIIDYQFATEFSPTATSTNDKELNFPYYMIPANAQMFEMSNLPYYLNKYPSDTDHQEVKAFYKKYLTEKSKYHKERFEIYKKQPWIHSDALRYEYLQGKVLKNPSDDIVKLQAEKLQIFYAFREVFSTLDRYNQDERNLLSSVPLSFYAAISAKKFADSAKKMKETTSDPDTKEFLDYEAKLGSYWQKKMIESGTDCFNWVYRAATGHPFNSADDISNKIDEAESKKLGSINNIVHLITGNSEGNEYHNHPVSYEIKKGYKDIANKIHNTSAYKRPTQKEYDKELRKIELLRNNMIASFTDSYNNVNNGKILAGLIPHLKTVYYARLLNLQANKLYLASKDYDVKNYVSEFRDLGSYTLENFPKTVDKVFKQTIDTISGDNCLLAYQLDSKDLNDFDTNISGGYMPGKPLKFTDDD